MCAHLSLLDNGGSESSSAAAPPKVTNASPGQPKSQQALRLDGATIRTPDSSMWAGETGSSSYRQAHASPLPSPAHDGHAGCTEATVLLVALPEDLAARAREQYGPWPDPAAAG